MLKKIFMLLATVLLIIGGIAAFHEFSKKPNLIITFTNAKHLMVDDNVYLSGALAGKVNAVEAKTRQVEVTINLKKNCFDQISSTSNFYIDNDAINPERQCLLIRLAQQPGPPIPPGARLIGTDSAFVWALLKAEDQMAGITHSEPLNKSSDDLKKVWQDIRQAFEDIDLEKMERELREKTESLRHNFNQALDSEALKQAMTEIEEKLKELQQTLKEAGDSQTAQKLKQNLEDLFKRLQKEAPERSDVKI